MLICQWNFKVSWSDVSYYHYSLSTELTLQYKSDRVEVTGNTFPFLQE